MNNKKSNFIYTVLLLLSVLVVLYKFFLGFIPVAYKMDYIRFFTQQIRTVEDIKAGFFPLWNPYILCGMPTIANAMTNLFSPFIPIYLILKDPVVTYIVVMILELFILGLSFFYMMKNLFKVSNLSAYTASITFTFCGFLFWNLNISMRSLEDLLCFYPLAFICYHKMRNTMNIRWGILMGALVALTYINCNGSILAHGYDMVFLGLFHLFFILFDFRGLKKEITLSFMFAVCMLLSIGLCAFQILPIFDAVQESTRFTGVVYYSPEKFIPAFFSFIYPDIWPAFQVGNIRFIRSLQYGVVGYISIPAVILAVIGAFYYKDRKKWFFILYPLAYLIIWPVYTQPIVQKILPAFIKSANHLFYSFYLYSFCVAVLAGLGMQVLKNNMFSTKKVMHTKKIGFMCVKYKLFLLMLIYIMALSGLLTLYIGFDKISPLIHRVLFEKIMNTDSLTRSPQFYTDKINHLLNVLYSYLPVFILSNLSVFTGLMAIYILIFRQINYKKVLLGIIPVCVLLNMVAIGNQHIEWNPHDYYYPETSEVKFLKEKSEDDLLRIGVFYEDSSWFWENNPDASFEEFNDFSYNRLNKLHENIPIRFGLYKIGAFSGLCPYRRYQYFSLLGENNRGFCSHGIFLIDFRSKLLDIINMKYVLYPKGYDLKVPKLEKIFKGERYDIYENKNVFPRTFLVPKAQYVESFDLLAQVLSDDNTDFSKEVFISEIRPEDKMLNNPSFMNGKSVVKITEYSPNEIILNVNTDNNGWVILADAYHHGWHAYIDGSKTQIYPANHLLRAVYIEKGEHTVKFKYFPKPFRNGLIITTLSILLCILLMLFRSKTENA